MITKDDLKISRVYNFKNQSERLIYMGYNFSGNGYWHQFEKLGSVGVWCEILDSDLHMIKITEDL